MTSSLLCLAVSIVSLLGLVNAKTGEALAASNPKPPLAEKLKKKARSKELSLAAFVQKLLNEGIEYQLGKNIGAQLGFPDGAPTRLQQVEAQDTVDQKRRSCYLVIEKPAETEGDRPVCLLILSTRIVKRDSESYWFRLNLDGTLNTVFSSRGKNDEAGKPIRGSGVKTDLDPNAPETKALLQRELDFWLKGKYRKSARGSR